MYSRGVRLGNLQTMGHRSRSPAEHPLRVQRCSGSNHMQRLDAWRERPPVGDSCVHSRKRRHHCSGFCPPVEKLPRSIALYAEAHAPRFRRVERLLNLFLHRAPVPSAHAAPSRHFGELLVPSPETTCSDNCLTANFHAAHRGCFSPLSQRNSVSGRTPAAGGGLARGAENCGGMLALQRSCHPLVGSRLCR